MNFLHRLSCRYAYARALGRAALRHASNFYEEARIIRAMTRAVEDSKGFREALEQVLSEMGTKPVKADRPRSTVN